LDYGCEHPGRWRLKAVAGTRGETWKSKSGHEDDRAEESLEIEETFHPSLYPLEDAGTAGVSAHSHNPDEDDVLFLPFIVGMFHNYYQRQCLYMRTFAEAWPDDSILQQLAAKLPWGHHMVLLDRVKESEVREWYLRAALQNGWSRNVLVHMISGQLREREGKALTNFQRELPPPESDLAEQILKDPYNFDFLTVTATAKEREIENGLLSHLRDLLLELGRGFSFVGSQVPLTVDDRTFYIDLLFYHVRLHRFFVFELKISDFEPEYAS
jgi:predicted nuclease of restriction endonuclease-like (RecB) superfamily